MKEPTKQDYSINGVKPINSSDMTQYNAMEQVAADNTESVRDTRFSSKHQPKSRKGVRNKVSNAFLNDLYDVWQLETDDGPTLGTRVLLDVAVSDPSKLLAAMVQVLPKDFQVSVDVDQVNWVICATPALTTEAWLEQHNLIEQDPSQDSDKE